jgi:hypothetical protein
VLVLAYTLVGHAEQLVAPTSLSVIPAQGVHGSYPLVDDVPTGQGVYAVQLWLAVRDPPVACSLGPQEVYGAQV